MPQMANIVLEYPAETDNTFLPMSLEGNLGSYSDSSTGSVRTWPKITISTRTATPQNGGHKVILRMSLPVARNVEEGQCCTPIGAALPANLVTVEFLRSNDATADDVLRALSYLQQVVADDQFVKTAKGESLR